MNGNSSESGDSESVQDRIARLARMRKDEKMEEYKEKHEKFTVSKRALQAEEDDEEEDDNQSDYQPPAKFRKPADPSESAYQSSIYQPSDAESSDNQSQRPLTVAEKLMQKMGHKTGEGLGKNAQGRAEPVALSTQRGRTGLGSLAGKAVARDFNEEWDETTEEKTIEETVRWMSDLDEKKRHEIVGQLGNDEFFEFVDKRKMDISDETNFCDQQILTDMLKAKDVFDAMSDRDLREARTRANPYETIGSAFFQNRAAMKTANMDKIYDWILSRENTENDKFLLKNPLKEGENAENIDREAPIFYFADVCAGPGGFSEYMLWRKGFYNAKGFGFTLAGKDDFKLQKFCASSAYFFETFYGKKENGDVMDPENIDTLEAFIARGTGGEGVHLMMADGGFSVEGQENLQEILSKRLYLCQLLVSLCIVREGGNFFCKLFDIFTPFSVALIYLMRVCYQSVSLHKPHTSRPANSERYITCKGLRKEYSDIVRDYLKRVNKKLDEFAIKGKPDDIHNILPLSIIKADEVFMKEIVEHNHHLAIRQTLYLRKYQSFAKNQGQFDKDQGSIRDDCLKYWAVPNRQRQRNGDRGSRQGNQERLNPMQIFGKYCKKTCSEMDMGNESTELRLEFLQTPLQAHIPYEEYRFVALGGRKKPQILIATGDTVFIFEDRFQPCARNMMRIPENTILLVDMAQEVEKRDNNRISFSNPDVIRIIDAAVLAGDDVSLLPYEKRMEAAEKFAKALKLTNRTVKEGWGRQERHIRPNLTIAARIHSLEGLAEFREGLDVVPYNREMTAMFKEGDFQYKCYGLRFNRIIKSDWNLYWSRSQRHVYASSLHNKAAGSIFSDKFVEKGVYSSFWDTAIVTRKMKEEMIRVISETGGIGGGDKPAVPAAVWYWKSCMRTQYGPDKILNHPEAYEKKPTVAGIRQLIEQTDKKCQREKKPLDTQSTDYGYDNHV